MLIEGTGVEGFVETVDVEVPREEDVAAELKAAGIADLEFPEIEQVVGSTVLDEEQKEFGSERID